MKKKSHTGKIFGWLLFTYPITLNVAIELGIEKPFLVITTIAFIILVQLMQAEYRDLKDSDPEKYAFIEKLKKQRRYKRRF